MFIKKTARYTFVLLTAIQLALAIVWVVSNITVVPDLAVCREYIDAANRRVCDEYMNYFYMYFVRFILLHTSTMSTFAPILYLFQLVFATACVVSFAKSLTNDLLMSFTIGFFIISNPFFLSTIMQVSPVSIYISVFLWVISIGVDESLLREKQIYGNALGRIAKWGSFILIVIGLMFVNNKLATPQSMGRCERTLKCYELQRFVWPHFSEITYTFYLEQTGYDSSVAHANYLSSEYMWDTFVPSLYEHYGDAGKEVVERYVDEFGFTIRKKDNIIEWSKDILSYFFAPYTIMANEDGKGFSKTGKLYNEFTKHGPLSSLYWRFSDMFTAFFTAYSVIGLVSLLFIKKVKRYVGMKLFFNRFSLNALLFTLAFSLYVSFFTLRGFDYRNAVWMCIIWPILFLFPFLSDDYR